VYAYTTAARDQGGERGRQETYTQPASTRCSDRLRRAAVRPGRAASARRGQQRVLLARRQLRASVPGIWAAGDCCTVRPEAQAPLWFQMRLWTQARPGRRARAPRQPAPAGRAWPWSVDAAFCLVRSGHARLLRSHAVFIPEADMLVLLATQHAQPLTHQTPNMCCALSELSARMRTGA